MPAILLRVKIDIISDVVCPWCFIGKRRLEQALDDIDDAEVAVSWRPFQLNPEMPAGGMDRARYLRLKFGGGDNARRLYGDIARAGRGEGIDFAFDRIARTPSTIDAHRLIARAGARQDALVEALFRAYFIAGIDIGDPDRLVDIAADAGLEPAETAVFLAGDAGADAVRLEDLKARRLGVTGVPCFIVDGRYAVSGAQAPEVLKRVFETALQAEAS